MTRADLLREARRRLTVARIENAPLDARLLLLRALDIDNMDLVRAPEAPVSVAQVTTLETFVARRIAGEPVARILGEKEFFGLSFRLSPDTLVPRPDTELVVEEALRIFHDEDKPVSILDLGVGSGCILLAFLHQRPAAAGIGIDRSLGAIQTARANAERLQLQSQASFLVGSWADSVGAQFDLVVSNPPYIPTGDIAGLSREVARHDPTLALDGGPDGLAPYRMIFHTLHRLLRPGGVAIVEMGFDQRDAIVDLAAASSLTIDSVARDLAGHDRVAIVTR